MLGKMRFILVILLFAAMSALCRTQAIRHAAYFDGKTFLVQQTASHNTDASRFCGHTCLASDVMNEVQSPGSELRILSKHTFAPNHNLIGESIFGNISRHNAAIPPPLPKDYYVYSFEKIRI